MRVFNNRNGVVDFTPVSELEDRSIIYDVFLKLDRLTDITYMLERSLADYKKVIISKDEWLFKFIACCGCDVSDSNRIILDREDIKVLLDFISDYIKELVKLYVPY